MHDISRMEALHVTKGYDIDRLLFLAAATRFHVNGIQLKITVRQIME